MPRKERKRRPLPWDAPQEKAFALVFEGRQSLDKIALNCTIPLRTLKDWIAHPDWQERVRVARLDLVASLTQMGIGYVAKEQRLIALSQMGESARQEYEARPLLTERRQTGMDRETNTPLYLINESFNRDAHAAFRESLDDIARELGERRVKTDVAGAIDVNLQVSFYLPTPEAPPDEEETNAASS